MEEKNSKPKNNLTQNNRVEIAKRTTYIGMVINLILLIFKFIGGILGNSSAMIADSIHSLSDFISDFGVILGFNAAKHPADSCHNYGHGKYETLVTLGISLLLFAVAIGIVISAIKNIFGFSTSATVQIPKQIALIAAVVSIISKEVLFRFTRFIANKINSKAIMANAWHHRSDALSSIASLLGIGGAMLLGAKWAFLDPLASIIVSLMLTFTAKKIFVDSIDELVEKSLNPEENEKIINAVTSVNGVYNPHKLRTRKIGNSVAIELHIEVDPELTVSKAHDLASEAEKKVFNMLGEDTLINVHIEPKK